jgi:hypothetical protein
MEYQVNQPWNENTRAAFDIKLPEWLGPEDILQRLASLSSLAELNEFSFPACYIFRRALELLLKMFVQPSKLSYGGW